MANRFSSRPLTPLMRAAATGQLELVQELLSEGVDVDELGPRDSTALMFAAGGGHFEIVRAIVEAGADVELREEGGWDALMHAEADEYDEIAEYLRLVEKDRRPGGVSLKASKKLPVMGTPVR